jgi:hypothetical protein
MSAEFPLSNLYLTPRAVATAQAANVMMLGGSAKDVNHVNTYLNQELPYLIRHPDTPAEDMVFIMRWSGIGPWQARNPRWRTASGDTTFLPAGDYCTTPDGQAITGPVEENGWVKKTTIEALGKTVVQLNISSWEHPGMTYRLADALLKWAPLQQTGRAMGAMSPGPQPHDPRVGTISSAVKHWPNTFSVLRWVS